MCLFCVSVEDLWGTGWCGVRKVDEGYALSMILKNADIHMCANSLTNLSHRL